MPAGFIGILRRAETNPPPRKNRPKPETSDFGCAPAAKPWEVASRPERSVDADVAVLPEPLDLVLHEQFLTFEFHYF
jgi:hypothetical protein